MKGPGIDRHPFTSTFLLLFLLDGFLGMAVGMALLTGRTLFDPDNLLPVTGPFGLALLLGAMVQVTLAFSRNMRWSARWIGLFVIFWQFVAEGAILLLVPTEVLAPEEPLLADPAAGWMLIAVNTLQLGLGLWAAMDLREGHYRPPE